MAEVPVRQPRFLGEKVPYREQTIQESIQQELGSGYTVEQTPQGFIARANPVQYVKKKDTRTKKVRAGQIYQYGSYSPHELVISPEGKVLKETKRATYKTDASGKIKTWDVYESEVTDYEKQTRYTFGKRDLKSGRETIRKTSSLEGGVYKEKRIIDQDTKEYEQARAEHELFSTFVGQGRSYAEARILSRMSEAQREARFKQEARERTQRFGLQGKAVTLQHQAQREFEAEYKSEAQRYATEIVTKQESARSQKSPVVESPKPVVGIQPSQSFEAPTPASPTTKTDMGDKGFILPPSKQYSKIEESKPFQYRTGFMVTDAEKYQQQQILESDNVVQRQIDKYRFGFAEASKQLDFHPILSDVAVPFAVGSVNIIAGTVAHPVQAVKSMFHPVELAKNVQSELSTLTATKGEVYSLSYFGGTIAGAEVIGRAGKRGVELAKDVYVKAGAKEVPAETVFEPKTITGEKTFFTVRSTAESLEAFNKGGRTPNIQVAQAIVKNPEAFAKPPVKGTVIMHSEVLRDIQVSVPQEHIAYTGGVARRVLTGEGRIRDVDVVTATPKADAYAVAKRFPEKYEVIQHEVYPEIYRLRPRKEYHKQLGTKPVADFDPRYLAEEGLINEQSIIRVGEYNVVKPDVLLKSKATQILKGKVNPKYPLKQAENIQQLSPGTPIIQDQVIVTHISPAKIKGLQIEGKLTEKAGLEDTGLYVTPKGKGSTYFTGLTQESTSYSLNPFKGIFGIPTATEIAVRGAKTYPKEVVMKPGFEHLAEYQKSQAGKGYVWITKRSQIGTGDIPRQRFFLSRETTMSGKTVEPGWRWEAGTSEGEAVIGESEMIEYLPKSGLSKFKGFDKYTVIEGRAVAVREARLLEAGDFGSPEGIIVSAEKIKGGSEALEVVQSKGQLSTVTPLSYAKGVPFGSLKTAEVMSSKPPTVTSMVDLGGVSSRPVSSKTSQISGLSRISPTQSVTSKVSSVESLVSPVRSPVSRGRSGASAISSIGGLSSGRSFGGSSRGGSSGISRGGSTPTGRSGGSSGRPSEGVPPTYQRVYPRPETKAQQKKEQFKVQVRKKGIFKTIAVTETPEEAFRIGKFNVEQTASASLRVKPVGSGEKVTGIGKGILPQTKFRLSQKEPDVFIQRRRFRIGTPGEKKEITQKGLLALKGKKIFGGLV